VCRGLMLALHRMGHIALPPARHAMPNPLAKRRRPAAVAIDETPIAGRLSTLGPLEFHQVRRTPLERLANGLIETYHYLGYTVSFR
ncbi:MAG: DUF4338 domain-containing protein, partial [Planctomycetes bacterium]|nr:DUF4338 domain-containing protein [Planctomycetota bacterium]